MTRSLVLALTLLSTVTIHGQELQEGTWGGTLSRTTQNNPRPLRQKFALEFKKTPDPHWAWRPGGGEQWTITVISQQGRAQAMGFRLEGEALSFAYRREDSIMNCRLTRQADGSFEGDCIGDADATMLRATLTPVKTPAK